MVSLLLATALPLSVTTVNAADEDGITPFVEGGGILIDGHDSQCGVFIFNYDFSWENGVCWQFGGLVPPDYGAFAEGHFGRGAEWNDGRGAMCFRPPPERGECCLTSGECILSGSDSCWIKLHGEYLGDNVPSEPNPCGEPGACLGNIASASFWAKAPIVSPTLPTVGSYTGLDMGPDQGTVQLAR